MGPKLSHQPSGSLERSRHAVIGQACYNTHYLEFPLNSRTFWYSSKLYFPLLIFHHVFVALVPLKKPKVPSDKLIMGGMAEDSVKKCSEIENQVWFEYQPNSGLMTTGSIANSFPARPIGSSSVAIKSMISLRVSPEAPSNCTIKGSTFILDERS